MDVLTPQVIPPAATGQTSVAPTGRFLRNTWYPILWSADLAADALVGRVALDEPIVFFRRDDGTPAAIADVCSHRFAPLHLGKRCAGDRIRCGYHGLEFDASGACVRNPHGDGRIPAGSSIRAYPLVERHQIIWLWMGTRTPDPATIPDFSIFDNPAPGTLTKFDGITMAANYELIVDNLMDLSHTAFLHDGLLGNDAMTHGDIDVRQDGNTVYVARYNRDVPAVKVYDLLFRQDGKPFDFWDTMRWDAPGCFLLDTGVHAPGATKAQGTGIYAVHLLTPETATSTNYLFSAVRQNVQNGQPPTPEIAAKIGELRRHIFQSQDTLMIEAQQAVLARFPALTKHAALFSIDAGPARYKRVLRALLDADGAS
jgi:phenylpropionate dioxygenase-like ring-hydroxylating dioxygenase large terminal subunit